MSYAHVVLAQRENKYYGAEGHREFSHQKRCQGGKVFLKCVESAEGTLKGFGRRGEGQLPITPHVSRYFTLRCLSVRTLQEKNYLIKQIFF